MTEYGKPLSVTETGIPGLVVFDLPVHGDARGWFKENWQREKMMAFGLPDFRPVQNNVSFNDSVLTDDEKNVQRPGARERTDQRQRKISRIHRKESKEYIRVQRFQIQIP